MRSVLRAVRGIFVCCATVVSAQTADELVAKNTAGRGGLEKIKAIKSLRMTGRLQQGGFAAAIGKEAKAPDLLRQTLTIQNMTEIQAYDGSTAWQISPFEGRKDPELLGEDEMRDLVEDADFYGPLIDHQAKGNKTEDTAQVTRTAHKTYRLKATLTNASY